MIFEKLQLKRAPRVKDWYLKIDTISKLFEYHDITLPAKSELAFKEFIEVDVYKRKHYTNFYPSMIAIIASLKEDTFINTMAKLNGESIQHQLKLLIDGNILFFNCNGGFTFDTINYKRYNVLEIIEKDKLIFPQIKKLSDVRYIKWPAGKHWYAKIGNLDILDSEGNQKWDTKKEAIKAAKEFLISEAI